MKPEITTATGRVINFVEPDPESFSIRDIAIGLSRIPRFAGHTDPDLPAYSVAEHAVWVSRHCAPDDAMVGLLHDASEAYMIDVPTPLKGLLGDYKQIEARVSAAIFKRFDLESRLVSSMARIKHADNLALLVEARDLRAALTQPGIGQDRPEYTSIHQIAQIRPIGELRARTMFLDRFVELKGF